MWGEKSVASLISLFLNPENKTLGGEAFGADQTTDSEATGLDMAKKLIYVMLEKSLISLGIRRDKFIRDDLRMSVLDQIQSIK